MIERISDEFTKYHLQDGSFPFDPVIHHFTQPDSSDWNDAHDHPWDFTSHVLWGWYVERVYDVFDDGSYTFENVLRDVGSAAHVDAEHIHRIIEVSPGGCYTIVVAGPQRRETHFWRFDEVAHVRPHYKENYEPAATI